MSLEELEIRGGGEGGGANQTANPIVAEHPERFKVHSFVPNNRTAKKNTHVLGFNMENLPTSAIFLWGAGPPDEDGRFPLIVAQVCQLWRQVALESMPYGHISGFPHSRPPRRMAGLIVQNNS